MTIAIAAECHTTISTPIGRLLLLADDRGLRGVYVESQKYGPHWPRRRSEKHEVLERAACQLNEYFDGERTAFDLPLAPEGTEFQLRVWRALCQIDFGSTESYGGIARRIGRPDAPRAVGTAVGHNPISIIMPCHRVLGSDGSLTGFAGGLGRKQWLLSHEGVLAGRDRSR